MPDPRRRDVLKATLGGAAAVALVPELAFTAPRLRAPFPVALFGAGRQGRAMLAELAKLEDVQVVALCDPVASRLSSGLRRAKGAQGYATADELYAAHPELEAVLVATPTHTHREVALRALAEECHVYCEAPLAHTLADALAIRDAARASVRTFQVGSLGRVNPIYELAFKFFRTGSIGDPVSYGGHSHQKNSWRVPVQDPADEKALNWRLDPEVSLGLVGELGVHQLDVIHWFANRYPKSARGRGAIRLHDDGREVHDTVQCELAFDDGTVCHYEATLANSFGGEHELVHGTLGAMKLAWDAGWMFKEPDAPTQGWEVYANRESFAKEQGITLIADATKLAAQDKLKEGVGLEHPPLYYGLASFVKSCAESEPVECGADEGARALAVALAAKQAIETGAEVPVDAEPFEQS